MPASHAPTKARSHTTSKHFLAFLGLTSMINQPPPGSSSLLHPFSEYLSQWSEAVKEVPNPGKRTCNAQSAYKEESALNSREQSHLQILQSYFRLCKEQPQPHCPSWGHRELVLRAAWSTSFSLNTIYMLCHFFSWSLNIRRNPTIHPKLWISGSE